MTIVSRRSVLALVIASMAVCLVALTALGARAAGTAAAEAANVAAAVQTFYDQTQDVSARFSQVYVHKLYNRTERSQGQVVFQKPGKMRWDYASPNGKVIVADGNTLQVFDPGEGEDEPPQLLVQDMKTAQLPNAMAFLMGTGRLEDDFAFRLLDRDHKVFPGGSVLELRPKVATPHYDRILFYVSSAAKTRGLVQRLIIVDAVGNRNRFDFAALKFNTDVANSRFDFDPPAGTRRVQP